MGEKIYENPYPQDSWEARLETMIMVRSGQHHFPEFFHEAAKIIGPLRGKLHVSSYAEHPEFDRGAKSTEVDVLGVLGEMVMRFVFYRKQIPIVAAPLLSEKTGANCDIVAGGYRIEVKGVSEKGWDFLVNDDVMIRDQKKNLTHYLHVRPVAGYAEYWLHTYSEAAAWPKKNVGRTDAYFKPIKDFGLRPAVEETRLVQPAEKERSVNGEMFV